MINHFSIKSLWCSRQEDAAGLGERLAAYTDRLAVIDPALAHWDRDGMRHRSKVPKPFGGPASPGEMGDWIAENPTSESRDGYKVFTGYSVSARTTGPEHEPSFMSFLSTKWAAQPGESRGELTHSVARGDARPSRIRHIAYNTLIAMAEIMEVGWCVAANGYFGDELPPHGCWPIYRTGWMVYLDAAHAARITLPEHIEIEHVATGGLLMKAAGDFFDPGFQRHRQAAQRIQRALAPLESWPATEPIGN